MSKKNKETNVPLIFALVLFILTTIAFGVMWYMGLAEQEKLAAAAKKTETEQVVPIRAQKDDAERKARVYRVFLGIATDEDRNVIETEGRKEGVGDDVYAKELEALNEAMAKKLGKADHASLPATFRFWNLEELADGKKRVGPPPANGLVDAYAAIIGKEVVYAAVKAERDAYAGQIAAMKDAITKLNEAKNKFDTEAKKFPDDLRAKIDAVTKAFDNRTKLYQDAEKEKQDTISALRDENTLLNRQISKLEDRVKELMAENQVLIAARSAGDRETFTFEEPQGKILRKRADGTVEIDLGSAAGVRPGLTFTALPSDYPQKGRQSRLRMVRVPDGKGGYMSVQQFVPKGSVEIYEVVSPNLSLARIVPGSEMDPIRDGITTGDLLYNSAWRRGVGDHIALIGIFDTNGDGVDDILSVVKDMTRMGLTVDAYYDMRKRTWVGQITERTRYIVEGYRPLTGPFDPNRSEKDKLLGDIENAISAGHRKGATSINFRDFFARTGYKYRIDVTDDKINQATAPYLSNVPVADPTPAPNP